MKTKSITRKSLIADLRKKADETSDYLIARDCHDWADELTEGWWNIHEALKFIRAKGLLNV